MAATVKLTAVGVDKMKVRDLQYEVRDAGCRNLCLVVYPTGTKTFIARWKRGGRQRKQTIGRVGEVSLSEARDKANECMAMVRRGEDPIARAMLASADTVEGLVNTWIERDQVDNRSVEQVERMIEKKVLSKWRGRLAAKVTRKDVAVLLAGIRDGGAPTTARLVQSALGRMFKWSVGVGLLDANPMIDMPKVHKTVTRDRVLSDAELRLVWLAAGEIEYPFGPAVRLLALTACRRDEIMSLRWSEVDLDAAEIHLPANRVKGKRPQTIPLAPAAVEILRAIRPLVSESGKPSRFVFTTTWDAPSSGFSRWKRRLDKLIAEMAEREAEESGEDGVEVAAWRLHDLRRTADTKMNDLGVEPHVVSALLSHKVAGVAGVYNRSAYAEQKKAAARLWADRVLLIVDQAAEATPASAAIQSTTSARP